MRALTSLRRLSRRHRHAAVSVLLLGAMALTLVGMPILPSVDKDTSIPFPCQYHACGCRDADACWKSCCCMTRAEKLAWAARNKVLVPGYAVQTLAKPFKSCCEKAGHCSSKQAGSQPKQTAKAAGFVQLDDYHRCRTGSSLWSMLSHGLPPGVPVRAPEFGMVSYREQPALASMTSITHVPPSPPPELS